MSQEKSTRIIKNTLMLYFRQILILFVGLYTVRVVLNILGVDDFGVYNAVGGVVLLFSFLSGSMASATQRFFSFALGKADKEKLRQTFSVNLTIYSAIAFIAFILLETVGLRFVNIHLSIPQERFVAALYVYHFSVLTFVFTIFVTPFIAIIIAHEDMGLYAYVSIVEALLKLLVAFFLVYIEWDKLELYGFLLFCVAAITALLYIGVCTIRYEECQFRKIYWSQHLLKEIVNFTLWTLFGQLSTVFRSQAVTILMNQMFNPATVAARVIAISLASNVNMFSVNFNKGLYPPIIKAYAVDDKKEMFVLIFNGSKIGFFLMWIFALPMFLEMNTILSVWLKEPPQSSILFARLALIETLIFSISLPIATAARAPGKMKVYELSLGCLQILIFVFAWIIFQLGCEAYSVFVVAIIINIIMFFVRLIIVRSLIGLSLKDFFRQVMFPVIKIGGCSVIISYIFHYLLSNSLFGVFCSILLSMVITSSCMYLFGLDEKWRGLIKKKIASQFKLSFRG